MQTWEIFSTVQLKCSSQHLDISNTVKSEIEKQMPALRFCWALTGWPQIYFLLCGDIDLRASRPLSNRIILQCITVWWYTDCFASRQCLDLILLPSAWKVTTEVLIRIQETIASRSYLSTEQVQHRNWSGRKVSDRWLVGLVFNLMHNAHEIPRSELHSTAGWSSFLIWVRLTQSYPFSFFSRADDHKWWSSNQ